MKRLIDKYIRKRIRIEGNRMYMTKAYMNLEREIKDVFCVPKFNIREWFVKNLGDVYSIVYGNGTEYWYKGGQLHREEGPAVIYTSGVENYFLNGWGYTKKQWKKSLASS